MKLKKRMEREEFRQSFDKGNPIKNICVFKHVFASKKPSIWIEFTVNDSERHKSIVDSMEYCERQVQFFSRVTTCKDRVCIKKH